MAKQTNSGFDTAKFLQLAEQTSLARLSLDNGDKALLQQWRKANEQARLLLTTLDKANRAAIDLLLYCVAVDQFFVAANDVKLAFYRLVLSRVWLNLCVRSETQA